MSASESAIRVQLNPEGKPVSASAELRLEKTPAEIWPVVIDVDRYPGRVPMIHRVRRDGDTITIDLKFKVSIVSVGFHAVVKMVQEPGKWLELSWISGEPRALRLKLELVPLDDGRACLVRSESEFDAQSLGWLTKYFLRHHPEIEFGIFPGVALALVD